MNNNTGMDRFIYIFYIGLIVFFLYRLFKEMKNKKLLEGKQSAFNKEITIFEKLLIGVLLASGAAYLIMGIQAKKNDAIIMAIIMLVLSVVFAIAQNNKLYIAENGMVINSNFYTYKELKKWGFDKEKNDLVLQVKKQNQASNEFTKVRKEDINEINTLIRRYKLNK